MSTDILIVDDEADIRSLIQGILEDEGYEIRLAENSTQAFAAIEEKRPGLIILDIWLQGSKMDGLEILEKFKAENPDVPVIMISGHGTIETAVSSIKQGAYDFIEKPFKSDRLILMIQRALETAALRQENRALKQKGAVNVAEIVGKSQATQDLLKLVDRVAQTNSRVLITGEAGVGKDVVARTLYRHSDRADKPFVVLSCATMHPERLELELFGSAHKDAEEGLRVGVLEQANGGTLFLDEVSDMPLETQGKIVRVLQEQRFQKIGGAQMIETDVRIIASTNRDLEEMIAAGKFREDLYYRLNVVPIDIKPLRERQQDIPLLAEYFVDALGKESGLPAKSFSAAAMKALKAYGWPGNVRQLRNVVEWTLIMNGGGDDAEIAADGLPPEVLNKTPLESGEAGTPALSASLMDLPLREAREVFEREYLESQVERFDGNVSKTAEFVGMERSALHRKLKSLKEIDEKQKDAENSQERSARKRA